MSFHIIRHMYVMYPLTTYMWSLCNIVLHIPASITPFVALSADQSVVYCTCQFIACSNHFNCTISTPFFQRNDVFYLLCTRTSMVLLLRNNQRQLWHLGWYICWSVCVYVVNGISIPCLTKKLHSALPRLGPQSSWPNLNRRTPTQGLPSWAAS